MLKLEEFPRPMRAWFLFWQTVLYLFGLGVALALLVEGTTLARVIGAVLLVVSVLIAVRLARKRRRVV